MTDLYEPEDENGPTALMTCSWCGLNWGDHESACPYGGTRDEDEEPIERSQAEDAYVAQYGWRRDET